MSTREEAGRKGGNETKKRHGSDFFKKIGAKGGKARGKKLYDEDGTLLKPRSTPINGTLGEPLPPRQ